MSTKSYADAAKSSPVVSAVESPRSPSPLPASRMHSSSDGNRDRMKKWIEAKHRRQATDDNDSLMSIVTTGDEIPRPLDPDDAAYRGRVATRSRIGTIQSYRDALLSPKKSRRDRSASSGAEEIQSSGAHAHHSRFPSLTPPPVVVPAASQHRKRVAPRSKAARLTSDEDDDDWGHRTKSSKRRRMSESGAFQEKEASRHSSRRSRPLPFPILDSEEDLPPLRELMRARRSPSPIKKSARSAQRPHRMRLQPRRLFRRDSRRRLLRNEPLFDDEATDDQEDFLSSEMDMSVDEDEYDYADSFINDSGCEESDSSLHSAHSRRARANRSRRRVKKEQALPDVGASSKRKTPKSLQSPFRPSVKAEGNRLRARARAPPSVREVLEISSGPEDEAPRSNVGRPARQASPVVKMEVISDAEPPTSRPKPRPVVRKAKASDSTSEPSSKLEVAPEPVKGEVGASEDSPPMSADLKGKGRAKLDEDEAKAPPLRSETDDSVLHPDERIQLERALKESRELAEMTKKGDGGLISSPGASSSSRSAPPATPTGPAPAGRVRMADLVATVSDSPTPSASQGTSTGEVEDSTTIRRCTSLPDVCEVFHVGDMDILLRVSYNDLPNLRIGILISWSEVPGKGFMKFSKWAVWCPNMNGKLAYDGLLFVKSGNIFNLSRCSPLDVVLRAPPQTSNRFNFYTATNPPQPVVATSCIFLDTSQLVSPSTKGLRQKYITGNFHSYDWQRFCGFIRTASGFPSLHAQLARDCLQFSTRAGRSQTPSSDDGKSPGNIGKRSTPDGMFQAPSGRSPSNRVTADSFSLPNDAIVPVYDARTFDSLDFATVLPRIADTLPLYTGGEIPYGSFVMVGYTVTIYKSSAGNWTLGCNIQWAIVIGTPHD